MASILRSSKFVRYIAGFARNVVINPPREFDGNFVNTTQCTCGAIPRSFASQASEHQHQHETLEHSLRRIDQDVRKSGRISRRDIEDVLEEIRSSRSATSSQSLLVIRCCGNLVPEELPEVRTKLVEEIWSTLNKLKVPMDISHYNALLRVYLENEHPFSPTDFLATLETKGLEPNRVTYQRLIARYCQDGDMEGATKILEFMREKQLPVNENVFNALIVGHSQAGDMESALGILGVMQQAGLEPSADTYTTLLCGYAKKGDLDSINTTLVECETKDINFLDKDYLDVIYALATNGHVHHVPEILTKVRRAVGYNQDAINLIFRLINKGEVDTAFLVLQSMVRGSREDGTPAPLGNFFVKQLVKANAPVDKIVECCKKLQEGGMYDRGLSLATEFSLELGNEALAYPLMRQFAESDQLPVRQHYFWPLIIAKAKDNNAAGIIQVLQEMSKFNITASVETLRDYVIPNLKGRSSEILEQLREANISLGLASSSLVHSLLQKNEMEEAALLSGRVPAFYNPDLMRRSLTAAYYNTKDLKSWVEIVRNIYENLDRKFNATGVTSEPSDKTEMVGSFLLDLTRYRRDFVGTLEPVLEALIEEGLTISTSAAETLQEKLGEQMTDRISQHLSKLTSGDLTPRPVKGPSYTPSSLMNIAQLERLVQNLDAKGQPTKGLKRQLLTLYHREKDLGKVETLLGELEKDGEFQYTPGVYAQLADLYAYHGDLDKALGFFNKMKELNVEGFSMDESKTVRIASLLVQNDRLDEAIALLESTPRENNAQATFGYSNQVWRMLNSLAEAGKADELDTLFQCLVKNNFIEPTNTILGPLIKVHYQKGDVDKALERFEWCVNQYKATPWKNELACKLIQSEDAEKLQKLTDLSTQVHGEINSLYDLVFAFVECGRVRQARKILETPGLQNRPQRINHACERYRNEGMVEPLEGLKDATRDLNHIDRSDIYYQLLLSYIKQDDADKAIGLWTQMQEEDQLPSENFLETLGKFLQKKNVKVPFAMPKSTTATAPQEPQSAQPRAQNQQFRNQLKNDNLDSAFQFQQTTNGKNLSLVDESLLLEKLTQGDRMADATKLLVQMLERNRTPVTRVFRFVLNKLASAGDVAALDLIGSKVSQDDKKVLSFDNRYCHANLVSGRAEDYLRKLGEEIDRAKDEAEVVAVAESFPRGGAYGILEKHPELTQKYEDIAIKYAERGVVAPMNVLWTNYFIQNNDRADEVWKKYLSNCPRIMFQRIVHEARDQKDETLVRRLIEHLKISNVTEGAIGNAYSCLIDVLVAQNNTEEATKTFETAVKEVGLDHINRTAIVRIKEIYDKTGKEFHYTIPAHKKTAAASSTSSSDNKK